MFPDSEHEALVPGVWTGGLGNYPESLSTEFELRATPVSLATCVASYSVVPGRINVND